MTIAVSNGQASAATTRAATISDMKDGMDQLNAAVQNFSASDGDVGDVVDKTQRQQIIDAAHKVLNSVKGPDDVWVDSKLRQSPIWTLLWLFAKSRGVFGSTHDI